MNGPDIIEMEEIEAAIAEAQAQVSSQTSVMNGLSEDIKRNSVAIEGAHGLGTEGPHTHGGEAGGGGMIDGDYENAEGVDFSIADATKIYCDIFHLGKFLSENSGTVVQTLTASKCYYVQIDMSERYSLTTAAKLVEDTAWPASNTDLLVYKLCEVNADGDRAILYSGCWLEADGAYTRLRFGDVVAPDVPIGTLRMWNDSATVPLGWEIITPVNVNGHPAAYMAMYSGTVPYTEYGATLGYQWHGETQNGHPKHDLSHEHVETGYATASEDGNVCITYVKDTDNVKDWTDDTALPDVEAPDDDSDLATHKGSSNSNTDTDNRPPATVFVVIIRTALA